MCPACLAHLALAAIGAASGGSLGGVVLTNFRKRKNKERPQKNETDGN
jgi:hypothetical protein